MSTIVLVTNENEIKNIFKQNIVLLREADKLISVTYENAMEIVYQMRPNVVIIHEHENSKNTLELINYLKSKNTYKHTSIILLCSNHDNNFILSAYDAGIDDFLFTDSIRSEILVRTINGIKKSNSLTQKAQLISVLEQYNIIEAKTGFYSAKFESEIIETELNKNPNKTYTHMIISPDEASRKMFSNENFVTAIKQSVRSQDIVFGANNLRYTLLMNTNTDGAIRIFEKIKSKISNEYNIKAGISAIETKSIDEIKKRSTCAFNNALLSSSADYVVYSKEDKANDNWLEIPKENEQTFKFLKKAFAKKIENVIAPVFYRLQKLYSENLADTKIEQYTDIEQCVFRMIHNENESRITMRYPNYSKLIIHISHKGFDTPEDKEITIPLSQLTQDKIDSVVENFVQEFVNIHKIQY